MITLQEQAVLNIRDEYSSRKTARCITDIDFEVHTYAVCDSIHFPSRWKLAPVLQFREHKVQNKLD